MNKKCIKALILLWFVIGTVLRGPAIGQTQLQVVTKTLVGEESIPAGTKLVINGENAVINCESHTGKSILYKIEIIAKHTTKKTAEMDLEKMKWIKGRQGKSLIMRNYIELEAEESRPESNLKAVYHIKIPETCPLTINNYFGEIFVKNTIAPVTIISEFARIELFQTKGKINVSSTLGDISGIEIIGGITINSNRSNLTLESVSGALAINASLAKIRLKKCANISNIQIEAKKSEITIDSDSTFSYSFDIKNAEFEPPAWMKFDPPIKNENTIKVNYTKLGNSPLINIKLNIGTLEIKP